MKRRNSSTQNRRNYSKKRKTQDMSQYVKRAEIEKKYHTVSASGPYLVNAGTTTSWSNSVMLPATDSMVGVLVGGTNTTRIGKKITVKSIRVNGQVQIPPDASVAQSSSMVARILLVCHKTSNGSSPVPNDVMSSNGIYSFANVDHFGQYQILDDVTLGFPYLTATEGAVPGAFHTEGHGEPFKLKWKSKKGLEVEYNAGNTGNATDVVRNNVFVITHVSQVGLSPIIAFASRISFVDL